MPQTSDCTAPPSPLARFADFFATLAPQSLEQLDRVYSADVRFRDPFNDVQGLAAVRRIFAHMYATTEQPRFEILHAVGDSRQGFLSWDFRFRTRGRRPRSWCIHGATRVEFDADGRVSLHRDYWDPAEELYAKLPLLGGLMRALQRSLRA